MNRCPNCAAQNRDGAKFCTSCGFRLPAEEPATAAGASSRSPFSTTSSVNWADEDQPAEIKSVAPKPADDDDRNGYAAWTAPIAPSVAADGPGGSWESPPPVDTAVPVSDEMIASLIGEDQVIHSDASVELESGEEELVTDTPAIEATDEAIETTEPETTSEPDDVEPVAAADQISDVEPFIPAEAEPSAPVVTSYRATTEATAAPGIDGLLKLARELEYGLTELADVKTPANESTNLGLLSGALHGLTSDDELAPLRTAISTAQDRPRDVDVMLDLVLRADAMASILGERDQLKSAIELTLRDAGLTGPSEPGEDSDQ